MMHRAPPRDLAHSSDSRRSLRYVARAGLLPELSRQTYDSLDKALREAILNSVDAGAHSVLLDFSRVASHGEIQIADDGVGMTLDELENAFLSLAAHSVFVIQRGSAELASDP